MNVYRKYLFLLIFLSSYFSHVRAQELALAGTIDGKHAIHMFLDIKSNKAEALYFYDRIGLPIYLSGGIGTGKFAIGNDGEQFTGMINDKSVTGTWNDKKSKRTLPLALKSADSSFSSLSGNFKCEAVRKGVEQSARTNLMINFKAGQVTRLDLESIVMPAAHSCNPDYTKLKQSSKGRKLLIESAGDDDQRCPLTLRRAGNYVLIQNEGGGCLCGARASVPDILLDLRNSSCRIAQ